MSDLTKAWDFAQESFAWADYAALLRAGVPKREMAAWIAQQSLGADSIKISGRSWTRQFMGERAVILPVTTVDGDDLLDLVAVRPEMPKSFWTFTGGAAVLGYAAVTEAVYNNEPLFVHESPMEWVAAGGRGCVILDWQHFWPAYFSDVPIVRTANIGFARRLKSFLQAPFPAPEIQVAA